MRLIRPTTITPAMITACNVAEDDYPDWVGGTTYTAVTSWVLHNHKIYQCLITHTTAAEPDLNCAPVVTVSPKWLDAGYDNRWKMFDEKVGSQTAQATSITLSIAPGLIDSIAFLDLEAASIDIVMTDPVEGVVYTESIDLVMKTYIIDAYSYFFEPIILDDTVVLLGIPPYPNASIDISITNTGGTAKVGTLVLGTKHDIGDTQLRPSIGIIDYSVKTKDEWGNYSVTVREYSKTMACSVSIDKDLVDFQQRTLASYRGVPIIWVGLDQGYSCMVIYGFFNDFKIVLETLSYSICNIEIEGLV